MRWNDCRVIYIRRVGECLFYKQLDTRTHLGSLGKLGYNTSQMKSIHSLYSLPNFLYIICIPNHPENFLNIGIRSMKVYSYVFFSSDFRFKILNLIAFVLSFISFKVCGYL